MTISNAGARFPVISVGFGAPLVVPRISVAPEDGTILSAAVIVRFAAVPGCKWHRLPRVIADEILLSAS